MTTWQRTLEQIQALQRDLNRRSPWRDAGLVARSGASETEIQLAERRIGRALPPSYRAFLREHDGWPRFFDGASLLGTHELGDRSHLAAARATFEAADAPIGNRAARGGRARTLIPFGCDAAQTTIFAFNADAMSPQGEYEVVAWVGEIGLRRDGFPSFLSLVRDLCAGVDETAPPTLRRIA